MIVKLADRKIVFQEEMNLVSDEKFRFIAQNPETFLLVQQDSISKYKFVFLDSKEDKIYFSNEFEFNMASKSKNSYQNVRFLLD